jgi:hypothetical protein
MVSKPVSGQPIDVDSSVAISVFLGTYPTDEPKTSGLTVTWDLFLMQLCKVRS